MDVHAKAACAISTPIVAKRNGTIFVSPVAPMIVGSVETEAESVLPTDAVLPMAPVVGVVPVKIVCADLIVSAATTHGTTCV